MDCNKDEATRAKEIAEKKFMAKDIAGAKKFALKAQNLFPGLEGIPQMLATLDVYISAENKINGEADWYGILGVEQQADDEAVRKQYRKLALMLHPDKNKSIGAEGAFKLISEAWTLLSDKAKRIAYDQKRNAKSLTKAPMTGGSSTSKGTNGFYNFTKSTKSNARPPKSTTRPSHSSTPSPSYKPKPNTFWTVCHRCKMQYEYLRVYLNHNLLCPNCHEAFFAVETAPPPVNGSKPPTWTFSQKQQNSNHQTSNKSTSNAGKTSSTSPKVGAGGTDPYNQNNFQWGPFSRTTAASAAAQAASMVQQAYEKVKREREEAQAATKREEALRRKHHSSKKTSGASSMGQSSAAKRRRVMDDVNASTQGRDVMNQMGGKAAGAANLSGSKQAKSEAGRVGGITKLSITKDVSHLEIQNMLMEKARKEIGQKLKEWNSAKLAKPGVNGTGNQNEKAEKTVRNSSTSPVPDKSGEPVDTKIGEFSRKVPGASGSKLDAETLETMTINVPDPDFHDFDKDRTERSFEDNQVWAAYDDDDGMPRYYAMIHSVVSLNPFKMRISWLNSKTNTELGPLNWVASGFSKTCGDFRVGKYEINNSLNSFSHKVRWSKGARGAIGIYPRKGDVWALYRNWSPDWNELTADEVIHKYDMVEVLEDYSEELGVTVTPLIKVAGFKTVFHRHLDPREVRRIPREEMFRFSHHVPSYLLTGQEAPNAPKGCRELDPAATPMELLQVITDVKEEEIVEIGEKAKKDNIVGEKTKEDSMVDDVGKANDKDITKTFSKASEEEKGYSKESEVIDTVENAKGHTVTNQVG
ncbi:uncharacterized protein LOC125422906 [Ziziphus jujuba]|uniref:Uncharacterized protein LOC125422906 n=1 Tax=Ziziphus jujuba TaxID=326968 RepID=A0ABM3IM16_ZIZJJ|nr:uncharacterized protein LOC107427179 [Ziziphus jujuba var. spinosa]XP_048331373.1 uncharacterized protein LOC125422906 [Ziziphus jujuba]